ncbi:hypothetical protein ACLB2K_049694 [Fragaria x ananassa]
MFLGAGKPAIPPLGVEPIMFGEHVNSKYELQAHREETSARFGFMRTRGAGNPSPCSSSPLRPLDPIDFRRRLLIDKEEMKEKEAAFRLELDKTLASFKSEMENVMQNVFDQFRLGRTSQLTPPPSPAQQPPKEHSSTPLSDSETAIPIVHSHLWKARCKEVARTSMRATGGVKKPHSSRLGASTLHKTGKYQKLNFRSLAASLLLDDAILAQSNHNPTSFGLRKSDMKVKMDSGDSKTPSELEDVTVRQDIQGPNSGQNGRECHALHLLDEMPKSKGLCSVGRTVAALTSIRDKGGGLAHQPLEHATGVNSEEEDEDFAVQLCVRECSKLMLAIHKRGFSSKKYKMAFNATLNETLFDTSEGTQALIEDGEVMELFRHLREPGNAYTKGKTLTTFTRVHSRFSNTTSGSFFHDPSKSLCISISVQTRTKEHNSENNGILIRVALFEYHNFFTHSISIKP